MKIGFIGLGRMGQGMSRRLVDAGYDLTVYDTNQEQSELLGKAGATVAGSIGDLAGDRDVVITMLPSDAVLEIVTTGKGGLVSTLPERSIHLAMGTHSVDMVANLSKVHEAAGQIFVASPVLGRMDLAAEGKLGIVKSGSRETKNLLQPIFDVLGNKYFDAGEDAASAAAIKIANNLVLGCAIEAMGEAMSLVRKFNVDPEMMYRVLTEGLFSSVAYKVYGQIMVDESYDTVGVTAKIGLKDANLALSAGETAEVPLPSGNVLRDRLLGAIAHGDGECDWSVIAREQARASGLE